VAERITVLRRIGRFGLDPIATFSFNQAPVTVHCFNDARAGPAPERRRRMPLGGPGRRGCCFAWHSRRCLQRIRPHGQIGGTHFKSSPARHSVLVAGTRGTRITLSGYVLTSGCRAIRGARVDFWQADANGVYDDTGVRLRSHQFTDARGHYWLQTILPGPYANRTRHLHVTVRARGERMVTTMLYFPGVSLNARDPFFDRRLLVRLRVVKRRFQARFDFVLGR